MVSLAWLAGLKMSAERANTAPKISIVLEGYNESRELGTADATMNALAAQDFPLDQIEVILVGSREQAEYWQSAWADHPFHDVKALARDGEHYFQLKNAGAEVAEGQIIAFTDSDVQPRRGWVSAIVSGIENGADVTVGPSLFHKRDGFELVADSPLMRAAASITWAWTMGPLGPDGMPEARGFMDHNLAMRSSVFRDHRYRTDLGRIIAPGLLFQQLKNVGACIRMQRMQQAEHHFSWRYWLVGLHFRYGHEVYRLRRLNPGYPNQWIRKTLILEPLVTLAWHMMLDVPRWFRLNSVLGTNPLYRWALLPVMLAMSAVARSSEALGMAATMLIPQRMRRWAENV
jgi:glycosyltransferase involved in cell wall biosynthesis